MGVAAYIVREQYFPLSADKVTSLLKETLKIGQTEQDWCVKEGWCLQSGKPWDPFMDDSLVATSGAAVSVVSTTKDSIEMK